MVAELLFMAGMRRSEGSGPRLGRRGGAAATGAGHRPAWERRRQAKRGTWGS